MLQVGVGLRKDHYEHIFEHRPQVGWFEAISENFMGIHSAPTGGRPLWTLERIRRDYPVVLHGVSLSIGSADPVDAAYLKRLADLYERVQPAWVSDHLCWTGVDGENLHDLLPLPFTREALDHVVTKVSQVQTALKRRILLENVSSYVTFPDSEMTEWEFLAEIARRSGCGILLDLNNVFVSAKNHGFSAKEFIQGIPTGSVGQFHLAGHSDRGSFLFDTHDHPVCDEVWALYREALKKFGPVPTLIEWDDRIPPFPELMREASKAETIWRTQFPMQEAPHVSPH
ncbi:MAG: DUF692 domain-containing protein [Bacteriovoracia bacterium]